MVFNVFKNTPAGLADVQDTVYKIIVKQLLSNNLIEPVN